MKSFLKVSAAVMMLAVTAAAMVLLFGSMDLSRGQPAAQAPPTPTSATTPVPPLLTGMVITPTGTVTPLPIPSVIVDPTLTRPAPTPYPIRPTATPLPATGGPYISEARAIEIALKGARSMGQVDQAMPPRAIFARARDLPSLLGRGEPPRNSDLEIWVVFVRGRFQAQSVPPGAPIPTYKEAYVVINATTGIDSEWGLRNVVP